MLFSLKVNTTLENATSQNGRLRRKTSEHVIRSDLHLGHPSTKKKTLSLFIIIEFQRVSGNLGVSR